MAHSQLPSHVPLYYQMKVSKLINTQSLTRSLGADLYYVGLFDGECHETEQPSLRLALHSICMFQLFPTI